MKTTLDFIDKVYSIFINGGIEDEIKGQVFIGSCSQMQNETIVINNLASNHPDDTIDVCPVNIVLWISDLNGSPNRDRFRYLIAKIYSIVENFKTFAGDFQQDIQNSDGDGETVERSATEYFHLFPIFDTPPEGDPEREGFSYWSLRLNCFYEH